MKISKYNRRIEKDNIDIIKKRLSGCQLKKF